MCLFKDGLSLQKTLMWVLQADKPSGTCIIMNYWSRAKTWVFRGKQSWVLWSCFVSHNDFTVMCNKGLFDPVNQSRKSQLERAYREEWKTNVLWEHLVPPFQQHFKALLPPTQHVAWLFTVLQSCTAASTLTLSEHLRLWSIICDSLGRPLPLPTPTCSLKSFQISWHNWHFQQHHMLLGCLGHKQLCQASETWSASLAAHQG